MRNLLSTTQILRRVFLPPLATTRPQFPNNSPIRNQIPLRLNSRSADAERKGPPIDEQIRAPYVQLVNAEGGLDPPIRLKDALASFERPGNFLQQVAPGAPGEPPICKAINRREKYQHDRTKAKDAQARKRAEPKVLELNWAIDPHDMSHRMKQLKKFLAAGQRVDFVLKRKKGKRVPTEDEIKRVMDGVMAGIEEADGTQIKPMEGEPGKQVLIFVRPKDS